MAPVHSSDQLSDPRCNDQPPSTSGAQAVAYECRRRTAGFSGYDFVRLGDPGVSLAASTSIIYHPPNIIGDYGLKQVGPVGEHSGNDVPRSKQHFIRYRGGGDHGNSTSVQEFLKERIEPEGGGYGGGVGVV